MTMAKTIVANPKAKRPSKNPIQETNTLLIMTKSKPIIANYKAKTMENGENIIIQLLPH